jgi:hypothetical protein
VDRFISGRLLRRWLCWLPERPATHRQPACCNNSEEPPARFICTGMTAVRATCRHLGCSPHWQHPASAINLRGSTHNASFLIQPSLRVAGTLPTATRLLCASLVRPTIRIMYYPPCCRQACMWQRGSVAPQTYCLPSKIVPLAHFQYSDSRAYCPSDSNKLPLSHVVSFFVHNAKAALFSADHSPCCPGYLTDTVTTRIVSLPCMPMWARRHNSIR